MSYELSEKQSIAWKRLEDDQTNEIMYGGAAGGGKSLLGCIWHIYRRVKYPGSRGLIGRAKLKALEESTLVTLFVACGVMGYRSGIDYKYNAQKNFIQWSNGSKTILKDLFLYPADPDFQSLGSTEYTDAFIDEATEVTLKAFDIVKSRIRFKLSEYGLIPKIYITGNPQPGWVKDRFVSDFEGKPIKLKDSQAYIQATVFDNPDADFVELYRRQLEDLSSDYDKARLLYGDWESEREVLRPFAFAYDESKHVAETSFNPLTQTIVVVDFNIDPFCANVYNIWKKDGISHCHQVDEIEVKGGTINELSNRIKSIVGSSISSLYLSGDAMGNNRTIGNIDNKSLFQRLIEELKINSRQLRIVPNPGHSTSREDVNYFLQHYPDFKIGEHCTGTRRDMRVVQIDLYGSIIKRNRKDEAQRADFIDNVRYLVNTFFKQEIEFHRKNGFWR